MLPRTATAVGHATAGKFISQGVSLVVAARPSAGRSPAVARDDPVCWPSRCRTGMGSGTLPLVKNGAKLLPCQKPRAGFVSVVARGSSGENKQSNAKVSQCSVSHAWLGRERKGGGSKTAPNPSVEGMAKRLRLLSTPHLER